VRNLVNNIINKIRNNKDIVVCKEIEYRDLIEYSLEKLFEIAIRKSEIERSLK
jgi:hypothetical protein